MLAVAVLPAAALLLAEVLVYVNQTIVLANDPPSSTASAVQVSLDDRDGRWMISGFEPK